MFSRDRWGEIFESIRNNKLRTMLSGFTISLGILIFIVLFGLGNGLRNSFLEFFLDDATNIIWCRSGVTSKPYRGFGVQRVIQYENSDYEAIQQKFGDKISYMTPRIFRNYLVKYKGESNTYSIRAVSPGHQHSEKTIIMKGRYLNNNDMDTKAKVVVIGRLVELDLFGKGVSSLGKYIDLGGTMYRVIGVFQDDGGDNEERMIYIPYTTLQLLEKNNDKLDMILVAYDLRIGYAGARKLTEDLQAFLRDRRDVHPEDENGLSLNNTAEDVKRNMQFVSVLQIVVAFVGFGTLLAGIIGISNIMVFVIKERTKELGIRKALGASPRTVIGMVLQESIFITLIAGFFGILLGISILRGIGDKLEDFFILNPYVDMSTILGATFLLILSGVIAGYIPARRAARIKPIEALKDS